MPKSIDITPSTEVLHATARTGYDTYSALFEFIDNSEDALREKLRYNPDFKNPYIHVHAQSKSSADKTTCRVIIADNGTGIDRSFIETGKIFSMGASATRSLSGDSTGVFGMGMKAATQAMGKKIKIITTDSDITKLIGATVDFNKVLQSGKWKAGFLDEEDISEDDRKLYRKYAGRKSGTVVVIDEINSDVPTKDALLQTLRRKTKHYYRHLLNPDSKLGYYLPTKIYIGGGRTNPVEDDHDPLCISHERTEVFIGDKEGNFAEYKFDGHTFKIRLSHTKLRAGEKKSSIDGLEDLGYGHGGVVRQGAYFIRHGREIASQPFWKHSSTAGNLFAEISFVDDGIGQPPIRTDYGKKGIVVDDRFKAYVLKKIIEPYIKKLGKESREAAKEATKGSRDQIKKVIEKTSLPSEHFGRARSSKKERDNSKVQNIFSKDKKSSGRKNSKYRGTSIRSGHQDIEIRIQEEKWIGSPFPYNVEYTAGDPFVSVILNTEFPWIKKAIYENTDPQRVARNMQTIAANCISLMYQDDEIKNEILESQGLLLNLFEDDFGQRIKSEVENMELDIVVIPETNVEYAEEMVNK